MEILESYPIMRGGGTIGLGAKSQFLGLPKAKTPV